VNYGQVYQLSWFANQPVPRATAQAKPRLRSGAFNSDMDCWQRLAGGRITALPPRPLFPSSSLAAPDRSGLIALRSRFDPFIRRNLLKMSAFSIQVQ
jgi:hypothetical protein